MCSYHGTIMKSTGEAFTPTETEWLDAVVQETIWRDADFWQSYTYQEEKNQISIWLDPVRDEDYLEGLDARLRLASKPYILAMLRFLSNELEDTSVKSEIAQLLVNSGRRAKSELIEQMLHIFSCDTIYARRCAVTADEFMTKN
jgi:hypothetical protein